MDRVSANLLSLDGSTDHLRYSGEAKHRSALRAKVAAERNRLFRNSFLHTVLGHQTLGWMAMKRLIDLLDHDDHMFFQRWADANVAVFGSALLVEILRGIVDLLVG